MRRVLFLLGVLLSLTGCCARERQKMQLLPDNATLPYTELLDRAKVQVSLATEAFHVDDWLELQTAALALDQTARLFPKALDIPKEFKAALPGRADELG